MRGLTFLAPPLIAFELAMLPAPRAEAAGPTYLPVIGCQGWMYGNTASAPLSCATTIPTTALSGSITSAQLSAGAAAANLAATPAPGTSITYNSGATGASSSTLTAELQANALNGIADFQMDPTGVNASNLAVLYAASNSANRCAYVPGGTYKITSQTNFSLTSVPGTGTCLQGDGIQRSILYGNSISSSPAFSFDDLSGSTSSPAGDFYVNEKGLGFSGSLAGTVLQIGLSNGADQLNSMNFQTWTANANTTTSANAISIGSVFASNFDFVANNGGHGDAVKLIGSNYSSYWLSAGNSDTALHFVNGTGPLALGNAGDIFLRPDFEAAATDVINDSTHSRYETFLGGVFQYSTAGIKCNIANAGFLFINPNDEPSGSDNLLDASSTGCVVMRGNGISTGADPAVWGLANASGTANLTLSGGGLTLTNSTASGSMTFAVQTGGVYANYINGVAEFQITGSKVAVNETLDIHYAGTTTCTVTGSVSVQINGVAHAIPYC